MNIKLAPDVIQELKKIKKENNKLSRKIEKQLFLFSQNPKHPSLRLHKLSSKINNLWSISVTMSFRMVYRLVDSNTAYFTKIGTHDEVYKK